MLFRIMPSLTLLFVLFSFHGSASFARHLNRDQAGVSPFGPLAFASDGPSPSEVISLPPSVQTLVPGNLHGLPVELLMYIISIEQRLLELEQTLEHLLSQVSGLVPTSAARSTTLSSFPSQISISQPTSSIALCEYPGIPRPVRCSVYSTGDETVTSPSSTTQTHYLTRTLSPDVPLTRSITISLRPPQSHITSSSTAFGGVPTYPPAGPYNATATYYPTASSYSYPQPSETGTYRFDPEARDNLAVYYGQTPATEVGGLLGLCNNPDVDIVILSFLFTFFTPHGYPSIDFGPGCIGPNAQQQQQSPGLSNCTALAPEITGCQALGKKVLVSLGGYIANTSFSSEIQTQQFSATLWSLFGPGTVESPDLRPFGPDVVIDGFDIDNENHNTTFYNAFARNLRKRYETDPSRTYYISAAPQCPLPDESIPRGAMLEADFVWVQFYNNPSCNLDSDGFQSSFAAWSQNLTETSARANPRIYIGTGAWEGAGQGYLEGSELAAAVSQAKALNVSNLGGVMLWDGSEATVNVDAAGVDYLSYAKGAVRV